MSDAEKFREYAQDCLRIADSMKGDDRETLLRIAKAWEERARHVEKKANA